MGSPPKRLFHFLTMLTAAAKISAAAELRRMAATLERQAEADHAVDQARQRSLEHRNSRRQVLEICARLIADQAPRQVIANRFPDFTPEQLTQILDAARPAADRIRRAERNREISRLAQRGWTNAELGRRFQISESQVTRILSDIWRKKAPHDGGA